LYTDDVSVRKLIRKCMKIIVLAQIKRERFRTKKLQYDIDKSDEKNTLNRVRIRLRMVKNKFELNLFFQFATQSVTYRYTCIPYNKLVCSYTYIYIYIYVYRKDGTREKNKKPYSEKELRNQKG